MALTVAEVITKIEANTRDFDRGINGAARKLRSFKVVAITSFAAAGAGALGAAGSIGVMTLAASAAAAAVSAIGIAASGMAAAAVGGVGLLGAGLVALAAQAQKSNDSISKDFKRTLDVAKAVAKRATEPFHDTFHTIAKQARIGVRAIEDEWLAINKMLAPIISRAAVEGRKAFVGFVEGIHDEIIGLGPTFNAMVDMIQPISAAFTDMSENILSAIGEVGPQVVKTLGGAIQSGMRSFGKFAAELIRIGADLLPTVLDVLGDITGAVGDFIMRMLEMDGIKQIIRDVGDFFVGLIDIIGDLIVALKPLFGPALDGLETILRGLGDGLGIIADAMASLGESTLDKIFQSFADALEDLGRALAILVEEAGPVLPSLFQSLGDILIAIAPVLAELTKAFADVLEVVTPIIEKVGQWIEDNPKLAAGLIAAAVGAAKLFPMIKGLVSVVGFLLSPLGIVIGLVAALAGWFITTQVEGDTLAEKMKNVWNRIKTSVKTAINFVKNKVIKPFVKWAKEFWAKWGEDIMSFFSQTWNKIKGIFQTVVEIIRVIWQKWGDDLMNRLETTWETIKGVVRGALNAIQGIFDVVLGILTGDWERVWTGIKQFVDGVWDTIWALVRGGLEQVVAILRGLKNAVHSAASEVWDQITNVFSAVWDWGTGVANDIINGITSFNLTKVWTAARGIWDAITGVLGGLWDAAYGFGADIVNGLWSGIEGLWGWLERKVSGFIDAVVPDVIADRMDLGSPSRLMASMGRDVVRGLAKGIEDQQRSLMRTAQSMVSNFSDTASMGLEGSVSKEIVGRTAPLSRPPQRRERRANITVELDGRVIARAIGEPLVDEIRMRGGVRNV